MPFQNPSVSAYATPEPSQESLKAWELDLRQKEHELRLQEFQLSQQSLLAAKDAVASTYRDDGEPRRMTASVAAKIVHRQQILITGSRIGGVSLSEQVDDLERFFIATKIHRDDWVTTSDSYFKAGSNARVWYTKESLSPTANDKTVKIQ
eukprot:1829146-Rhodomonas_salina.1